MMIGELNAHGRREATADDQQFAMELVACVYVAGHVVIYLISLNVLKSEKCIILQEAPHA